MPYGVDKSIGGDSKKNDAWMEKCVSDITGTNKRTGKPYTKGEKIAICKAQLKKSKSSEASTNIDDDILISFNKVREKYISSTIATLGVNEEIASKMFEVHLNRINYEI